MITRWIALALALPLRATTSRDWSALTRGRVGTRPRPPLADAEREAAEAQRRARRRGLVRFAREMAAGGLAEATMDGALYPIDTIKARRQTARRLARHAGRPPSVRELVAMGSPLRGLGPVCLSALPAGATFMGSKWAFEAVAHRVLRCSAHGAGITMLASACADVMFWLVRFPSDTGKLRVQALQDKTTLGAMRRLLKEGGYRPAVLYTGWRTVLWRDVPYDALEFGFYELSRGALAAARGRARRDDAGGVDSALCGALSALCASLLTTPFDVARTRIMTQAAGPLVQYGGVLDCLRTIARVEGPGALLSGLRERAVMSSVGGAIWFSVYELVRLGSPT